MSDKGITGQRDLKKMTALAKSTADLWGLSGVPKLLGDCENFVFEIDGHILRITEEHHRSSAALMGELDFVEKLSDAGVSVACPLRSENKDLVETVDGFHISVFTKAEGRLLKPDDFFINLNAVKALGRELGKAHKISANYTPQKNKRHKAKDVPYIKGGLKFISPDDDVSKAEFKRAIEWFEKLPEDNNAFGLIHMDAHCGNFHTDKNDNVTLFDFDDCAYHFFAYDLAIPLNNLEYSYLSALEKKAARKAFLEGYAEEYTLPKRWLDMIDGFIRFRNIEMYAWSSMMYGLPIKDGKVLDYKERAKMENFDDAKPYPVFKKDIPPMPEPKFKP